MKTNRLSALAVAVSSVFALSASAAVTETEWWNVDFTSPTPNGVNLEIGALGTLTNDSKSAQVTQPYASGVWSAADSDESYVTNDFTGVDGYQAVSGNLLRLDTQGNDLTWEPTNTVVGVQTLVDADLFLVGSDSEPTDFDGKGDVQTAIYLKNFVDDANGDTTNSVLCVYARSSSSGQNYWQELDGVAMSDNSWAHVQVVVDHSGATPMVRVYVNGTQMSAADDASVTEWTVANPVAAQEIGMISSISFRGTGAIDNFVGKTVVESFESYDFTAEVYMDGELVASGTEGNVTRVVNAEAGTGKTADFDGFTYHDWDGVVEDGTIVNPPTYALSKIELVNLDTGDTTVYTYEYSEETLQINPVTSSPSIVFATDVDDEDNTFFTGPFSILAPTEGATANAVIAKVYFKTLGAFDLSASTYLGGTLEGTETVSRVAAAGETYAFTFPAAKTVEGTDYKVARVVPGTGVTPAYANSAVTLTVPLDGLAANVDAGAVYYVEGTLTQGVEYSLVYDAENGYWTLEGGSTPPALPEVDAGKGLAAYKAANPDADVPDPVAFNETTGRFEVSFVAPVAGRYVLMVSETVDGTYVEDTGSAQTVTTAGEPVTLTESPTTATAKFFKIGFGE